MKMEPGNFCPLIRKNCIGTKCAWFVKILGANPQTGQEIEEYECAVSLIPMLQIEVAQMNRQTGAAVESFRNDMIKVNEVTQAILAQGMSDQNKIIPPTIYMEEEGDDDIVVTEE